MSVESDVRATMLYLTNNLIVQFFLSVLTGKALPRQQPLFKSNAATQLASSVLFLTFGIVGSFVVVNHLPIYAFPLIVGTWLFTVAGARKFQTEIHHQISHCRFSGSEKIDRFISDIFTTILMIQDFVAYKADHQNHHGNNLATANDPDASFLYYLGFRPGRSKSELWQQLFINFVSPKFYLTFLVARIKANFLKVPFHRKVLSFVWLVTLVFLTINLGLTNLVLVWLIPMIFLYQIAALLQFLTEHQWFRVKDLNETGKTHLAKLTVGRFFGEVYPHENNLLAKGTWLLRMVFYHGVVRLFVCQGTLPAHDAHHRMPGTKEWANLIFVRQNDIDCGCKGWEDYREIWGLFNMLDGIFEHLAGLPTVEKVEASSKSINGVVLGM